MGDNFGDSTTATASEVDRMKAFRVRQGLLGQAVADDRQPDLRSFDTATYGTIQKPLAEQRKVSGT
jgi:hypothetical protein